MEERDELCFQLVELKNRLENKKSKREIVGFKELKKELTDLKKWMEKKEEESNKPAKSKTSEGGAKGKAKTDEQPSEYFHYPPFS